MPVKFQSHSEYNQQFQHCSDPCDPPLPDFYKLPSQQKVTSQKHGNTHEPPLQHKKKAVSAFEHLPHKYMCLEPPLQRRKKPIQPHGSKSMGLNEKSDEYVLLGSQKKFAPNIIYKAKPISVSQEEEIQPEDEHVSTPMAPRPDPPPRVVVDTGAPKHLRKSDKQQENIRKHNRNTEKREHYTQQQNLDDHNRQQNGYLDKQEHNAREWSKHADRQRASKEAKSSNKDHYSSADKHQDYKQTKAKKSPPKPQQSATEPKSREKSSAVNPTNHAQNNGLLPEERAPSDYALKYKAGVAPPRGQGPKRLSEYQRQFAWKQGVESSPLLDAEQVVYKSSSQIIPKKAKFNKTTEYRREFKPWQSLSVPVPEVPNKAGSSQSSKHKMQRSKSAEAITPDKRQPAGKEKVTSEVDPRMVLESLNPLRPYFPHGPYRNYSSEYAANFAPPQAYEYEKGAWKGANPPQSQTEQAKEKESRSTKKTSKSQPAEDRPKTSPTKTTKDSQAVNPTNSWFMEVVELRRRAEEYKRRAQGTHFSRQHLVQLLAEQAELWDTASTSSVLSALSLEHPHAERSPKQFAKKKSASSKDLANVPPAGKRTAWGDDREPASSRLTDESARSASIVTTFDTQSVQNDLSEAPTLVGDEEAEKGSDSITSPPGRIPTPKMAPAGLRHHLDRTTPLQGGALLSSPPSNKAASMNNNRRRKQTSADSVTSASSGAYVCDGSKQPSASARSDISQASKSVNRLVKPLYGMPTRDTHLLVDETASVDRPLITDYVDTPIKHAKHNRDKFPDVDVPSTIQEDTADTRLSTMKLSSGKMSKSAQNEATLGDIRHRPVDDDVLSMSARSVASSCSLASEVLQRARERRDQFWGVSGRA